MGEEVRAGNGAQKRFQEEETAGKTAASARLAEEPGTASLAEENLEEEPAFALHARLAEEKARADDNFNRLARLQADFENFKRRTRQEREDFTKYASEQMVTALLPTLDNFERALASGGSSVEDLKSGVEMIFRQLKEVLTAEGLTPISAVGEPFDPKKHEAVMHQESCDQPDNTVIEELIRGYCLKDKVIRPAMVKVVRNT